MNTAAKNAQIDNARRELATTLPKSSKFLRSARRFYLGLHSISCNVFADVITSELERRGES